MSVTTAVISDSHVGQRISVYPGELLERLQDVDIIIHAGDHTNADSLDILQTIGELRAVRGNMDEVSVSSRLPDRLLFDIEGVRIGVTHGWGQPVGLAKKVFKVFRKEIVKPDIIIFGHSHSPCDEIIKGVRMLNPGAVSGNLYSKHGSYGILTIDGKSANWQIVNIDV